MMSFRSLTLMLVLWLQAGEGKSRRITRVIGGLGIFQFERKDSPLVALKYFVYMGQAYDRIRGPHGEAGCHDWSFSCQWFGICDVLCPLEDQIKLVCGGTLITPLIVQTACHCVAYFSTRADQRTRPPYWREAFSASRFEDRYLIYMGQSSVNDFEYPIESRWFLNHPLCGELSIVRKSTRYDVGWVLMEREVDNSQGVTRGIWDDIDYAGPFTFEAIEAFHWRVTGQRHVCLVIGFGGTNVVNQAKANTIKFGWGQVYDYANCYDITLRVTTEADAAMFNQSATWACYRPLANPYNRNLLGGQHNSGDSGSPFTCGNNWFAHIAAREGFGNHAVLGGGEHNISLVFPIIFFPQSVTAEHRVQFEHDVLDIAQQQIEIEGTQRPVGYHNTITYITPPPHTRQTIHTRTPREGLSLASHFKSVWTPCLFLLVAIVNQNHP